MKPVNFLTSVLLLVSFSSAAFAGQDKSVECFKESRCVQKVTKCKLVKDLYAHNGSQPFYHYGFDIAYNDKMGCVTAAGTKVSTIQLVTERVEAKRGAWSQEQGVGLCEEQIAEILEFVDRCK